VKTPVPRRSEVRGARGRATSVITCPPTIADIAAEFRPFAAYPRLCPRKRKTNNRFAEKDARFFLRDFCQLAPVHTPPRQGGWERRGPLLTHLRSKIISTWSSAD
jgi:hypothetical protein